MSAKRAGRKLRYDVVLNKVHYVQLTMQSCVYAYWGWYWREVYHFVPFIVAQLIFAYALDMLVCWSRRDKWILGFGPFPIILSTNLFLWFRDDWFYLQFLMVATGVLCKEFVKWKREGRTTHIFNPSAIALFIFSVALIATKGTPLTWGEDIATTFHRPPHIYLEIFLVGLVVQSLFSVTLVTLWAAASLCGLSLLYTHFTGSYHFIDSNIPAAVFLGLHLLVTDPVTSPRTTVGKILFGGLYGAGVFAIYGALDWFGAPTFYDKLLCVPFLNLSVQALDRWSRALAKRFRALDSDWAWNPQRYNLAHMGLWITLFAVMLTSGFLSKGKDHPGGVTSFWQQACQEGRWNGCKTWVHVLGITCGNGAAYDCFLMGDMLNEGRVVPRDPVVAGVSFGRACDLGLPAGCGSLIEFLQSGGEEVLQKACLRGDGASCFILGSAYSNGIVAQRDATRAFSLYRQSCANGWPRGCGRLAQSFLRGEGTPVDPAKAIENFEKACRGRNAPSCAEAGYMYRRGMGAAKDENLARQRFRQACELGLRQACSQG